MKSKIEFKENEVAEKGKRYPNLITVLMVEDFLKRNRDAPIKIAELKKKLSKQIMHQTLMVILEYLWRGGKIIFGPKGIQYIYSNSQDLKKKIDESLEINNNQNKTPEKNMNKQIINIIATILRVIKTFNITRAGIFGSYARGEQTKNSDIDILIEFKDKRSLFDLVRLENILREEIGKKVDLLTYNSINPLLKIKILSEEVRIL